MVIHIISGDTMNEYSEKLGFSGHVVVMNEEMMSGPCVPEVFSNEFIKTRSSFRSIHPDKYRKHTATPFLKMRKDDDVHLWFGKDMFCQINMLTVLAYLEKLGVEKAIYHEVFEDEMTEISKLEISTKNFSNAYESVLINHEFYASSVESINNAQSLYFETITLDGPLCDFIRENKDDSILALTIKIIRSYAQYGLSDVQCKRLIENIREI